MEEGLTGDAGGVEGNGGTAIAVLADALHHWNLSKQGDVHFLCQGFHALTAEEVVFLLGVLFGSEPCHVLHKTEDGNVHLVVGVHVDTLACIGQRHLLGGAYYNRTCDRQSLNEGQMNIGCAGRCVQYEIVEVAPCSIAYELLQGIGGHTATPQGGSGRVYEETYAEHLDAVFLNGHYQVAPTDVLAIWTCILHAEHLGGTGAEDVAIEQAHTMPHACQGHGQIGGHGALAHTTLATAYGNDILHSGEQVGQVGTGSLQGLCLYLYLHILAHIGMNGRLCRLDK